MNLPILQPQLLVGLETTLRGNIHFLSDDELVYPVGCVVTVHNTSLKKQRFIKLSDKGKNLTHLLVSPNKKIIAVAETTDKLPIVTLWDPVIFKKKRTLVLPQDKDIDCTRYACMEFTYDSKLLICVTAEPDWTFYVFKCDKGRLESFGRGNNLNGTGTVEQVACNPNDTNQIAVCGEQCLRCLGCVDYSWRQFGYNKLDPCHYTSCCWLSQDRLIVGSYRGKIMILETGEIRAVFHVSDLPVINMRLKEEEEGADLAVNPSLYDMIGLENTDTSECLEIRSIVNFNRGFVFAYTNGKVYFYEKENPNRYRKRGVFKIPDRTIHREYEEEPEIKTTVNSIAINSSQDRILVSCLEMQMWSERLFVHDSETGPEVELKEYGYSVHLGPVGGLSVCRWKPIVLSIGSRDRSVKLWNYETVDLELVQTFEDDIYSVSLHPTGLYAVIGFSDKLRFMTIMIDEIIVTKEFNIRNCDLASFSRLGHLFAAANGTVIQIYSSVSFELLYLLKGHNGKITGISWSNDDTILASCGVDGAVYCWDIVKATRLQEIVIKAVPARGLQLTKDGKNVFAVGTDGHIREYYSSNVQRDVVISQGCPLDGIILSALDNMLFVTGNNGVVYVVKIPLLEKAEVVEYNMHKLSIVKSSLSRQLLITTGGVGDTILKLSRRNFPQYVHQSQAMLVFIEYTMLHQKPSLELDYSYFCYATKRFRPDRALPRASASLPLHFSCDLSGLVTRSIITASPSSPKRMILSCDDRFLITASIKGLLCFWKLLNIEDKAIKFDMASSNETLISRQILEDKMLQIRNLQLRMRELETEHSYQMRQNDALAASKMKDIHQGYCNAIEELKLKNEQMEAEHIQEINSINIQINLMKQNHELFVQRLEASYNEKLITEYEKFIKFENKMDRMLRDAEIRYLELKKAKEDSETSITTDYETRLKEAKIQYDELSELNQTQAKDHEIIKQQIEDDADREIYELKESHSKDLKEEQDINVRLRSEISVVKKKLLISLKEVDDLKHKVFTMENEHIKFKNFIYDLEKEIMDSKKEIQERDQTIEEKEKRIFTIKSKNQELEKFKFILDFKIKELKSQIEPKERIITEQNIQINEMVRELENLQKVILGLDIQLAELKEKLSASNNEVRKEIEKNRRMKKSLQDIRIDIHQASGYVQNVPQLQKAVTDMYHKYNADKDFEVTQQEDTEAKNEFLRQRDFLERTVSTLHDQATKNTNLLSYDKVRLVDENASLLEETNTLRRNLLSEVTINRKLNSLIGMSRVTPQQAQQKVNFATATNNEIHKQYTDQLEQNARSLKAMTRENLRLLNKITEMDVLELEK